MNEPTEKNKRALIVFVKAPLPGDVKTRLIPHLSGTEAADLYKCFVGDTLRIVEDMALPAKLFVAYQSSSKWPDLTWLPLKAPPETIKQEGKSLGERLIHAFGIAFGKGFRQVVIIGSDSPNLPARYLDQAFHALSEADMVIGPALDGGYYLIGLSRPSLKLFDDVSWSTDQVFDRTTQNAKALGYSWRALPNHYDIDTLDDLHTLHRDLSRDSHSAPATRKFLTGLAKEKALFPAG